MSDDMGTFRVDVEIENPARPGERRTLPSVLVDTGSELSWVPAEVQDSLGVERIANEFMLLKTTTFRIVPLLVDGGAATGAT